MGILTEDMKKLVREQRLGFIATVCPDGSPNLSPKGTAIVLDDDHLAFADLASPGTIANINQNPAIKYVWLMPSYARDFGSRAQPPCKPRAASFKMFWPHTRADNWVSNGWPTPSNGWLWLKWSGRFPWFHPAISRA